MKINYCIKNIKKNKITSQVRYYQVHNLHFLEQLVSKNLLHMQEIKINIIYHLSNLFRGITKL